MNLVIYRILHSIIPKPKKVHVVSLYLIRKLTFLAILFNTDGIIRLVVTFSFSDISNACIYSVKMQALEFELRTSVLAYKSSGCTIHCQI